MTRFLCLQLLVNSLLPLLTAASPPQWLPSTDIPSLYVFGASMVDTGENSVAMPYRQNADFDPYGSDYFGKPTGRWSNGRNFMDLITQELGMGLLSPYVQAFGSNFTRGINFASSGSCARNTTAKEDSSSGLFPLLVQVDQFKEFREYVLSQQIGVLRKLHMMQHFSNSIFFIETAHNDYLSNAFKTDSFDAVAFTVDVIGAMRVALQALYDSGARFFVVMNVTPLGCNPSTASNEYATKNRDEYGCKLDYLEIVNRHNEYLVELLREFRTNYSMAEWILFDAYSIMLDGYHNPSKYGVVYPFQACCGFGGGMYNYDNDVQCGQTGKYINGTYVEATKCEEPSLYIIWDSLHPVESFCKYLAQGVLNGTYLYPAIDIAGRLRQNAHDAIEEVCEDW